jgi:pyruvate/2-oxoglutarate dehydrogenase complex dihydrolipoamide acyltransferase (E2) component
LGLVIGLAIGVPAGHSDPTTSAQYRALQQRLGTSQTEAAKLQTDMGDIEASAQAAQESAQAAQAAASASQAANAEQAAAIASQQAALSAAQQQIAANSIGEGTWTVGSNVAPGSYRTSAAVSGQCYWEITKSGTNGDVIIQNDIVSGGFPTVRLSVGQDFKNEGCGTFVKQ